eukprot:CAMPEP_0202725780 /NCGR_PEP_ID=MMETSP1385-20130828/184278_1 /ASSEMBLY_ACC=CAM_ASM_000861 /TAXON_ID=933848 /ORGANISM="Elphidium margaritaceum" /LENGTH=432 /DNA_ID=CAMNT_0049391985 /DNA_START=105 /DNA_END=1404 /DNA_ORIENTATION=-
METEAAGRAGGSYEPVDGNSQKKLLYGVIAFLVIVIIALIVVIAVVAGGNDGDEGNPSVADDQQFVFIAPDESDYDDGSGGNDGDEGSPSVADDQEFVFIAPDESDYDDGSGSDLDCTPGEKVFNADPFFWTIDICDGLYVYGDNFYMGIIQVTSSGAIFVDAPPSMWDALPVVAASVTDNPITTVMYSHHHGDHVGGASQIPGIEDANVVCHSDAAAKILDRPDMGIPACTTVLDLTADNHTYILQDDDKYVILQYTGYRWHSGDDLILFFPRQRTVMAVDLVYPKWIPFKNVGMAVNPDGYLAANHFLLDNVTSEIYGDWEVLVAGHVDVLGDREDAEINIEYVEDLKEAVHLAESNANLSFVAVLNDFGWNIDGTNNWEIVLAYQHGQSAECARILNEDFGWNSRFHGMDAFSEDNCYWMYQEGHINLD